MVRITLKSVGRLSEQLIIKEYEADTQVILVFWESTEVYNSSIPRCQVEESNNYHVWQHKMQKSIHLIMQHSINTKVFLGNWHLKTYISTM